MNASQETRPRRFYEIVSVEVSEDGFAVSLDGRTLRTPRKIAMRAPNQALAELVAEEWRAQVDVVDADAMPTMRLVNVAIDSIPQTRSAVADDVARFAETDLVCHLADAPRELAERQERVWAPLRAWAGGTLGVALMPVVGVIAAAQPAASMDAARAQALVADDFTLAGLSRAVALLGSAVLGFALQKGRLNAEEAFAASRIDESYQEERWGADDEAAARARALAAEVDHVGRFLAAIRD